MKIQNMSRYVLAGLVSLMAQNAFNASDGTLGTTSTGTSALSLTKADSVRITGMNDVAFGTVVTAPSTSSFDVCVYSTTGSYTVNATSTNGTGSTFRIKSGSNYITYDVEWNNAASGSSGTNLDSAVTSSTFTGANSSSQTCGGSENSRVFVNVNGTSFDAGPVGTYTDTLTIIITPV